MKMPQYIPLVQGYLFGNEILDCIKNIKSYYIRH